MKLIRDRQFWIAVVVAPIVWIGLWWWHPVSIDVSQPLREPLRFAILALVYPLVEEIVFRGGLQPWLTRRLRQRWSGVTLANLLTSIVFSLLHLFSHPPLWAAAVLVPSLVFGYFRERHDSLVAPIVLHIFYNTGYFWLFGV